MIFTLPKGVANPLKIGNCLWMFKNEVASGCIITGFNCLAPKLYELSILNLKTGLTETYTKVKGFTINNERQKSVLAQRQVFKTFVNSYLDGVDLELSLGQWNIKCSKKRTLTSVISQKLLKNSIFSKRVSFRGAQYRSKNNLTLPYGFTQDMYNQHMM